MSYTKENIIDYINEDDVKFIRLVFLDAFGNQKNVSIMPNELKNVFENGYTLYSLNIAGFENQKLVLYPDPNTISVLPWRPAAGKVVRMFCDVKRQDKKDFPFSTRKLLQDAQKDLENRKIYIKFRTEFEFYLFKLDEDGNNTLIPYDSASFMDVSPDDKGENVRREICLSLDEMEINTCGSFHDFGPGQNKILISFADPLKAAEDSATFMTVVKTISNRNGLCADFSHLPLASKPVNKNRIVIKIEDKDIFDTAIINLKNHYDELYLFLNNKNILYADYDEKTDVSFDSYLKEIYIERLNYQHNPYLVYYLLINAIFDNEKLNKEKALSLNNAKDIAKGSKFINKYLSKDIIEEYLK